MAYRPEKSTDQFSIDGMGKLSKNSMCIDFWSKNSRLLWSFNWHVNPYDKWLGKSTCLLQVVILMCFIWPALDKSSSIIALANADSKFLIEYHFHPTINMSLIFFCLCYCWFSFDFSQSKSHFILPISYISVTNVDFYFHPFLFHSFRCTFSIFKAMSF